MEPPGKSTVPCIIQTADPIGGMLCRVFRDGCVCVCVCVGHWMLSTDVQTASMPAFHLLYRPWPSGGNAGMAPGARASAICAAREKERGPCCCGGSCRRSARSLAGTVRGNVAVLVSVGRWPGLLPC